VVPNLAIEIYKRASRGFSENAAGDGERLSSEITSTRPFIRTPYARGRTIAAGSSEMQRTVIAERVLGLPRSGLPHGGK
jgi:alkylation response protein AidB-like acyl-CoA dehydrogenase